jgi:hypothetical protein
MKFPGLTANVGSLGPVDALAEGAPDTASRLTRLYGLPEGPIGAEVLHPLNQLSALR